MTELNGNMDCQPYNQGDGAGKKSGFFNLGTTDCPLDITPNNVLDLFGDMGAVAEENNFIIGRLKTDAVYRLLRIEGDNVTALAIFKYNA